MDVGGTFTDAVPAVGGRLVTAKAPTSPEDESEGVRNAVNAVLKRAGEQAQDVEEFAHGTTAATWVGFQCLGHRFVERDVSEDPSPQARARRRPAFPAEAAVRRAVAAADMASLGGG